uniref:Neuropeptide-like GPCR n=1 Tax=Tripedalia cystophora TaxID=6141 RepID=A0A481ZLK1_TRICY|nr:neuropeptide-like GPCR [Tripedalia cystophora]
MFSGLIWNSTQPSSQQSTYNKIKSSIPINMFLEPTFLILLLIATSITNSMLITKILSERKIKTCVNFYLIFQCIGNLGMSATTLPFAALAAVKESWPLGSNVCVLNYGFNNFFSLLCVINMTMIAYNRYKSLTTNSHRLIVKHVLTVQLGIWFVCAVVTFPWLLILHKVGYWKFSAGLLKCVVTPAESEKELVLVYAISRQLLCGLLPFGIIIWCLVRIVSTVQRTRKSVVPPHSVAQLLPTGCYLKSAYTNILLMGSFVLFWFPQFLLIGLEKCGVHNVPTALQRVCAYLVWLECLILPLICLFRNRRLIRSLLKTRVIRYCCPFLLEGSKGLEAYNYKDTRPSVISSDSFVSIANMRAISELPPQGELPRL